MKIPAGTQSGEVFRGEAKGSSRWGVRGEGITLTITVHYSEASLTRREKTLRIASRH